MQKKRITSRQRRHKRIRKKVAGVKECPRLCVYRSLSNFQAQIIDDGSNKTILSASTFDKEAKGKVSYGGNMKAAEQLGTFLAEKAKEKGISKVVFDRGGVTYHGRVKIFAEACRKAGLVF